MDMLDQASCKAFADRAKQMPEGFNAFKNDIHPVLGIPSCRFTDTIDQAQLKTVARAYNNAREALGDDIEIAVHCHNEFNEPSAVGIAWPMLLTPWSGRGTRAGDVPRIPRTPSL